MAKSGDLAKRGVVTGEVSLDIEAMMGEKSKAVTALTGGIKMLFKVNKPSKCAFCKILFNLTFVQGLYFQMFYNFKNLIRLFFFSNF